MNKLVTVDSDMTWHHATRWFALEANQWPRSANESISQVSFILIRGIRSLISSQVKKCPLGTWKVKIPTLRSTLSFPLFSINHASDQHIIHVLISARHPCCVWRVNFSFCSLSLSLSLLDNADMREEREREEEGGIQLMNKLVTRARAILLSARTKENWS